MSACPFCVRIKAGDFESFTDDPDVVWFEPLNPVTPGHMLFVPVQHVTDALADPYTTGLVAEIASRWWSRKWGIRAGERDCNLITSVGANATQTVRHLHWHLLPRDEGDGLALPWTGQRRAQAGSGGDSGAVPVSPDGGEAQGRSDALRAEAAGRLAYETWQRERGVPGDAHWDAMPAAAQEAWRATAQAVLDAGHGAPLPPADRGWRENVTCGNCDYTFGTNCDENDIDCPECEAQRCPCCGNWFGGNRWLT